MVQYLLLAPETPIALYGIMPDENSLPHFFPALFPYLQEPKDAEDYVQTCDKLKAWHLVHVNNCKFMIQLFDTLEADVSKGPTSAEVFKEGLDSIKTIYWIKHQKKLVGYCNDLL